jgi:hypothetical protein
LIGQLGTTDSATVLCSYHAPGFLALQTSSVAASSFHGRQPGAHADQLGHDLNCRARQGFVKGLKGLDLPPPPYANVGRAVMASQAMLAVLMHCAAESKSKSNQTSTGKNVFTAVARGAAPAWLAPPRTWGLPMPGAAVPEPPAVVCGIR